MNIGEDVLEKPTFWQLVFSHSRVNGAPYLGEKLEGTNWNWPEDTFLRRRLRQIRSEQAFEKDTMN